MSEVAALRGMAWDHPRAIDPLEAISGLWSESQGMAVDWDARPLKDFEDQPLEELAGAYDLVLMDYPFVGTAAESGMIVAANDWADVGYMQDQAEHSVGPSFSSYTWSGMQWALAIDAAAQVSASRPDLLASSGPGELPETWEAVLALAKETIDSPSRIALPLNPNHAYCAFLSVGLAQSGPGFWQAGHHVETASAAHALEYLRELSSYLHPLSQHADPIAISDRMSGSNEILFVPLMFGYSNYSRRGFRDHPIRFGNAPSGASGKIGSVLGGVGVAVSSLGTRQADAASLARLLVSPDIQAGLYVQSGGQPGHAAAWESDSANALVDNFFRATRDTMQQAFLRPRVAGHRMFQELAGVLISQFIWQGEQSSAECLAEFNRLTDKLLGAWV